MDKIKSMRDTLILGLAFSPLFAFAQPTIPKLDKTEYQFLAKKSGIQFAVADECGISNEIQKKIKFLDEFLSANYGYSDLYGDFNSARSSGHAAFNVFDKAKQCYISAGKTKSAILKIDWEIGEYYKKIKNNYDAYQMELMAWRESEKKKRAEKLVQIHAEARKLAESFGRWVIGNYYDGGQKITINLVEHDLEDFSQNTVRFKVGMVWSGGISGETGYGADGIISVGTSADGKWIVKDWSPSWESSKLKDYKDMRQIGNVVRSLLGQ